LSVETDVIRCTSCGHEFDARLEMMETWGGLFDPVLADTPLRKMVFWPCNSGFKVKANSG